MPEWLKGADCKSAALCYVGSNPTRPNCINTLYVNRPWFSEYNLKSIYIKIFNLVP